ncbi:MAG: hypothetical protein NZ585_04300 [Chloracidobacterium sp.]|nr:hypothetical protein [Chloracidobacterium sp.]MDW8218575.1 hypothetical protein [Acidobacteriota bacterium]
MVGAYIVLCAWLWSPVASPAPNAAAASSAQSLQQPTRPPETDEPDAAEDPRDFGTRDPLLEKRARKNIEVAEFYARQKNFRASINRLTEIYEVYPQFTRFDKILFLLGKYHLGQRRLLEEEAKRLSKQRQLQEAQRKTEEANANQAEARRYFVELIERFPESDLVKDARKELDRLAAPTGQRSPS